MTYCRFVLWKARYEGNQAGDTFEAASLKVLPDYVRLVGGMSEAFQSCAKAGRLVAGKTVFDPITSDEAVKYFRYVGVGALCFLPCPRRGGTWAGLEYVLQLGGDVH